MPDPILDNLNPEQLEAVTAPDGPLLIVAGAGSGKTRVITRRIAYLLRDRHYQPWQIFAATFTNKAAEEMKNRVVQLVGGRQLAHELPIATFHSLCARILRREAPALGLPNNFIICDERDQLSAVKHVMRELGIKDTEVKPSYAQEIINRCKLNMLEPEEVGQVIESRHEQTLAAIYEAYQKYIRASHALDFEDLIWMTVRLFQEHPEILERYQQRYRQVLVDEYQDINATQFLLVRLLAAGHHNIAVVGDEDQTIYSWRGADIAHLLEFEKYFPERRIIHLEQNYRSKANILRAASTLIANNRLRFNKTLRTEAPPGPPVVVLSAETEYGEAEAVAHLVAALHRHASFQYKDIAIFYRIAALSRVYEEKLRELNIPHRVVGGVRFYDRAEIKDMLAYLQVVQNPANTIALLRIINCPKRGIGDKSLERLLDEARRRGVPLYEVLREVATSGQLVSGTAATGIQRFVQSIETWREFAHNHSILELYEKIRRESEYDASLGDPAQLEVRSRLEHLDELANAITQFELSQPKATLADYLENVSLVNPTDDLRDTQNAVAMMTLHMAKGLEFRVVFIVGCSEGLLPYRRSQEEGRTEEERRLMYVGMTRARDFLVLCHCDSRAVYGERQFSPASLFLSELPTSGVLHVRAEQASFRELALLANSDGSSGEIATQGELEEAPTSSPRSQGLLGRRVRHALLGEGEIIGIEGSGRQTTYLLRLDDGQLVRLLARHAQLEVCG
ncbi:ATP-dependent DNA helicase UvrD/PcrA [Candidatus Sumerlaea chitinivorans]|uniref:DNA 3'-5' helicase n=1 Tax=Sumerlaea chitinivorans TaxID=2250252 RepID=A0A2Z4Y4Z8_SUMC1|nr:ATP-dependent DNA helicase UvrD/PcrA [Candidatus Sumerlaea chitinivorans]